MLRDAAAAHVMLIENKADINHLRRGSIGRRLTLMRIFGNLKAFYVAGTSIAVAGWHFVA